MSPVDARLRGLKRGFARCSGDGYPSELGAQLNGQEDVAQEYEGHCSFNVLEQVHCWVEATGVSNNQANSDGRVELGTILLHRAFPLVVFGPAGVLVW